MSNQIYYTDQRSQLADQYHSRQSAEYDNYQRVQRKQILNQAYQPEYIEFAQDGRYTAPRQATSHINSRSHHRAVSTTTQHTRSPAPSTTSQPSTDPLSEKRSEAVTPRSRPKSTQRASPKPQFYYEPHRANNIVFEESPEEIMARKKAEKSKRKNQNKFAMFNKKPTNDEADYTPSPLYSHRNGSDDALELMPTIAMGYENSLDKQMRNMPNAGELRITGNGYYFRPEEVESDDDTESDTKMDVRGVYTRDDELFNSIRRTSDRGGQDDIRVSPRRERTDGKHTVSRNPSMEYLQKAPAIVRSRSTSRERGDKISRPISRSSVRELSNTRSMAASPTTAVNPSEDATAAIDVGPEPRKKGVFKKLFSKKKKESKDIKAKELNQFMRSPDRPYPEGPQLPPPIGLTERNSDAVESESQPHSPRTPGQESPVDGYFEEPAVQGATLADLLDSIPILSFVLQKIDATDRLSDQGKFLLKTAIIIWIMYEMQMMWESITRIFRV